MPAPFNEKAQSWKEKIIDGDKIWQQVKHILQARNLELPETARRPDVRLILDNVSGTDKMFRNPGDHSNKAEMIPATGDKTAAMVMVKGDTLTEQFNNAKQLEERYGLSENGLSDRFVQALMSGEALDLVDEAYGPAPFDGQASKLVDVAWEDADGNVTDINPVHGDACAFGARAPADEKAFRTEFVIYVQGTKTTPEKIENEGMVIAISEDWQTGAESTRPIVPSVAEGFYGNGYDNMPVVEVHPDGYVTSVDLGNGTVIDLNAPEGFKGDKFGLGS